MTNLGSSLLSYKGPNSNNDAFLSKQTPIISYPLWLNANAKTHYAKLTTVFKSKVVVYYSNSVYAEFCSGVKPTFELYLMLRKGNKIRVFSAAYQNMTTILKRHCQFHIHLADILCKLCGLSNSSASHRIVWNCGWWTLVPFCSF